MNIPALQVFFKFMDGFSGKMQAWPSVSLTNRVWVIWGLCTTLSAVYHHPQGDPDKFIPAMSLKLLWRLSEMVPTSWSLIQFQKHVAETASCAILVMKTVPVRLFMSLCLMYLCCTALLKHAFWSWCYCNIVWGNAFDSQFKHITTLSEGPLKTALRMEPQTSTDLVHSESKTLPVRDLYKIQCLIFMFKYLNGELPLIFWNQSTRRDELTTRCMSNEALSFPS